MLDGAAAIAAGLAALFWFSSAFGGLPQMTSHWDVTPTNDPFYKALMSSATQNVKAAAFSGVSALFMAVRLVVSAVTGE
jgi:hypothetical protein